MQARILYLLHRAFVEIRNNSARGNRAHELADICELVAFEASKGDSARLELALSELTEYRKRFPGSWDFLDILNPELYPSVPPSFGLDAP